MSETTQQVLFYVSFPILATIIGAAIAAYRPPGRTVSSYIQHFAAGVVFAAVALELLPEAVNEHSPLAVIIGFSLGTGLMLFIRWVLLGEGHSAEKEPDASRMLITVGVDILVDGLLIGIGFAAGSEEGRLLTLALTIELLFLGLSVSAALRESAVSRGRSIALVSGLALLTAAGAFLGSTLFAGLSGMPLGIVLAFGIAALLYLVTEELLVEAHEVAETPLTAAMFFVGFLVFMIIEMLHRSE